jgi:hypothetical protein
MMNRFYIICAGWMMGLLLLIGAGCAEMQGRSIKTYHSDYHATVRASSDALENLEIPILKEVSDELKTDFLARRPNGTPVMVEVKRIDRNFTQVAVSTGSGVYRFVDRDVSNQIHGFIRKRLGSITVEE